MKKKIIYGITLTTALLSLASCKELGLTLTKINTSNGSETTTETDVDDNTTSVTDETSTTSTYDLFDTTTTSITTKTSKTTTTDKGPVDTTKSNENDNTTTSTTTGSKDTTTNESKDTTVITSTTESKDTTTIYSTNTDTTTTVSEGEINNSNELAISKYNSYAEGAYLEASILSNTSISDYKAYYKKSTDTTFVGIDSELVRLNGSTIRADFLGLASGTYDFMLQYNSGDNEKSGVVENVKVSNYDRSGYAHFNSGSNDSTEVDVTGGIGAYKNDGTLKDDATVVYVSNETKNTVTANIGGKTYTGISSIIQAQTNNSNALVIRILDTIEAATWNSLTNSKYDAATESTIKGANGEYLALQTYSESEIIAAGFNTLNTEKYSHLDGLTNKIKYDSSKKEFDSYYNMLDINNAKNVTVEGVGENAGLFQWGFTWKNSSSIEIRNLMFDDYTEDACSFEGNEKSATSLSDFKSGHLWIHQNTFNEGVNYWDVCSEQDKHEGDGATDFKGLANVTISYNHYYKNHKTGLVGGGDSHTSANFTFHHNFYDQNSARLPFARQANMHMYNNYYYSTSGNNMQIYAGAYAFIENCYFQNVNTTYIITESTAGTGTPAVKSYNNTYDNCGKYSDATIVTSRTQKVTSGNKFGQNFDTDTSLFYYDETNEKSNVSVLNDTSDVPSYVTAHAGRLGDGEYTGSTDTEYVQNTATEKENTETEVTASSWNTVYTDDFSTSKTITALSSLEVPTSEGIYSYTNTSDTSTNSVTINSDNRLYLYDNSASTTYAYYMFNSNYQYNTGIVKYSITFYPETANTKWQPIQFIYGSSYIKFGTDTSKNFYITNGTDTATSTVSIVAGQTYVIDLIVDYDNNLVTLKINDSTTINMEITDDLSAISGIYLMTAGSASRSFGVDNISISLASE